jgi:phosphoglycerate dehydrogenase-like enzyme
VISKWGTGIDSIDQAACAQHQIMIGNTPDAFINPVADTVLGYMLAFARRQPWMDRTMRTGVWDKIPGRTLGECTLGVVGVGRIGRAVLRRASAFGMTLLGTDIVEVDPHFATEFRVEITDLADLLSRSDFVSVNADLNPTSFHLMNAQTLALMQPGAVLINTARGPVVDEAALVVALEQGTLGGAALDVFEAEPLPSSSPLLQMEHVMLAPHNANSSPAAWERVHWNTVRNLLQGLGLETTDFGDFQ